MKISFCSIAYRNSKKNLEQIFYEIAKEGYDGIEVWEKHINRNKDSLKKISTIKNKLKISVPIISLYTDFTNTDAVFEKTLKKIEIYAKIAEYLNCPLLRIFTGYKGSDSVDKNGWPLCIKRLKSAASTAEGHHVRLAIETHPDTLCDNLDSTLYLMEKTGNNRIGINLDVWHVWQKGHSLKEILDKLLRYTFHIHVKNALNNTIIDINNSHNRLKKLDEGALNYKIFFSELVKRNYSDSISVEWFGNNPHKAAKQEIRFIRAFLNEAYNQKNIIYACNNL